MDTGPFATKKFIEIKGHRMAYIDEGEGAPIVFQHGNPSRSYLWRKVMPSCVGLGRLIACDLIGMGDSDKLTESGPHRYTYAEQREFLFALWEELGLDRDVVLVVHDWGAILGFDWARQNPDPVQGIAHMEAAPLPLTWADFPSDELRGVFQGLRSDSGEDMVLRDNLFVEGFLIAQEQNNLFEADKTEYRRPFINPRERPPRNAQLAAPDSARRRAAGRNRGHDRLCRLAADRLGSQALGQRQSRVPRLGTLRALLGSAAPSDRGQGRRRAFPSGVERPRCRRGCRRLRARASPTRSNGCVSATNREYIA
ncbi:MAG: haloalkane dehalogenase [Bradyrhizobium sp.]|nr:haloalkane dehalogenase [Bradyrhizobium sp.]